MQQKTRKNYCLETVSNELSGVVGADTGFSRRDVPVGVPLDLSTPTGMSYIGTCGENCKSDNVAKYRGL